VGTRHDDAAAVVDAFDLDLDVSLDPTLDVDGDVVV
jgi:hypothetical protein